MEGSKGSFAGCHWLIGLVACLILSGCIPEDAIKAEVKAEIKAAIASPEFKATLQKTVTQAATQTATQTGKLNIGNIVLNDGGIWILIGVGLLVAFLWWRGRRAIKTTDVLIGQLENHGLTKEQKLAITAMANYSRVGEFLKTRLKKVRKKMKKENGDENS